MYRAAADTQLAVIEENDAFGSRQDRHYTQGILFSVLSPDLRPASMLDQAVDQIGRIAPMFSRDLDGSSHRRIEFIPAAQSIFTPEDLHLTRPDPRDRPYAGWLYGGLGLIQENGGNRVHDAELLIGVVGPSAGSQQAQDFFHRWIKVGIPQGYGYELRNRPAIEFSYETLRRVELIGDHATSLDMVPELGVDVGNVFGTIEAGSLIRFGNALQIDYGPQRIRPALSGTAYHATPSPAAVLHYAFFIGAQLRYVAANTFIDRANEVAPSGLERKPWVGDWIAGAEVFPGRRLKLSFEITRRSLEFNGQRNADVFGSIGLAAAL
jgi:hypothetical protein